MSGFESFIEAIAARLTGPFSFRFIVQPVMAIILGVRDGLMDLKAGSPPYFYYFLSHPELREKLALSASASVVIPIVIGIILDGIVQYLMFNRIYPMQALLVGSFVIAVPYILARGLSNRLVSRKKQK